MEGSNVNNLHVRFCLWAFRRLLSTIFIEIRSTMWRCLTSIRMRM